jgi:F-type H+-transporting ATPase subunit gamma
MAQLQTLRRRIRSVSNTRQTTKAMQMVSASKLRKAQGVAAKSAAYIEAMTGLLGRLIAGGVNPRELSLWQRDRLRSVCIVAVASDGTLAGAYNLNIAAKLRTRVSYYQQAGAKVEVVAIGSQIARAAARIPQVTVRERLTGLVADPMIADIQPLATRLRQAFAAEEVDAIELIYTHPITTLSHEVRVTPIWPLDTTDQSVKPTGNTAMVQLEPSSEEVAEATLARLFDAHVLHATQEAAVSEHAMRMLTMRNATDNASDLIDSLTLEVNIIRQADITQELAEITGAAAAIEEQ